MLIGSICEIGATPRLLVNHNMPHPVFSDVWHGKDLREHFSDVWQRKDLARSVAKAPRTGRGLVGDTPAFCIDVNTKELLAEGFVSA